MLKFGKAPAVETIYLCCIISLLSHCHPSSLGVIAGVAVGCLSLSLLLTAATGVITFLCTRRCYNKKSSPPSPNEKSVYYETVQSDSVQMQPSPAYQSVEQVKWACCNDVSFMSFAHSPVTIVVFSYVACLVLAFFSLICVYFQMSRMNTTANDMSW